MPPDETRLDSARRTTKRTAKPERRAPPTLVVCLASSAQEGATAVPASAKSGRSSSSVYAGHRTENTCISERDRATCAVARSVPGRLAGLSLEGPCLAAGGQPGLFGRCSRP